MIRCSHQTWDNGDETTAERYDQMLMSVGSINRSSCKKLETLQMCTMVISGLWVAKAHLSFEPGLILCSRTRREKPSGTLKRYCTMPSVRKTQIGSQRDLTGLNDLSVFTAVKGFTCGPLLPPSVKIAAGSIPSALAVMSSKLMSCRASLVIQNE